MEFREVSRDTGFPPRFILKEEVGAALNLEKVYSVGGSYSCHYELTCDLAGGNQRKLTLDSGEEFKFSEDKSSLVLNSKGRLIFKVVFSAHTEGYKDFKLIIKGTDRQGSISILDRKLKVEMDSPSKPNVIGHTDKSPILLKLGENRQITFVFENKSDQEIKDFNIIIKRE